MQTKILCIDDKMLYNCGLYEIILKAHDMHIISASSGKDGLVQAIETNPDLIIIDHSLPDYWCLDLVDELRKTKNLQNVPILIPYVIGHIIGEHPIWKWSEQSELNEIVLKPVEVKPFMEKVELLLDVNTNI